MEILFLAGLAALFTFLGGCLPLIKKKLKDIYISWLVAFSAGILLSTGLNHMMVESYGAAGKEAVYALSFGFLLLFLVERFAMVHACREEECHIHSFGWVALTGIGFHGFLDGFAITVSMETSVALGYIVVLGILLHRFPTGISIASIMLANKYSRTRAFLILGILSLNALLGAIFGFLIPFDDGKLLTLSVGFSAGVFIYIATADLLPMVHIKKGDYISPLSFVLGFTGIMFY